MAFPNVADLSSAQRSFDAAAYAASGRQAVIIKSTESTTYHFAQGDTWEAEALAHGLVVGRYHWCGSSSRGTIASPSAEGDWFLKWNGEHTPGRFAAGDMEDPLPGHGPALYGMSPASAAAWLDEFLDYIGGRGGWPGLGYSFSGSGVVQRIRHAKWPASYPTLTIRDAALHQFSSSAPVPGVGSCDDSHCFIDLRAFAGASPAPTPALQEDALAAIRIPAPTTSSKTDPNGTQFHKPDEVYEQGSIGLFGKGRIKVTTDVYPANPGGANCRIAIGSPGHWNVQEIWVGAGAAEFIYDEAAGDKECVVCVYGVLAAPVGLSAVQTG